MLIREEIERREISCLSEWATLAVNSKGRQRPEEDDPIRTCFMRDRDRIVHSKSFRRLKHKTQVFVAPGSDHYRTRLTHTLEVNQIAKTIGAGLNLNLDLIEAIALGHDVGHTPFSHAGEMVLDRLSSKPFRHNENSLRVLTRIEQRHGQYGLNLTREVLDGILHHSGFNRSSGKAFTLEGQVIRLSDKIAYVQHDIDDSIRAGILRLSDIPQEYLEVLGYTHGGRIACLVTDTILYSRPRLMKGEMVISPGPEVEQALIGLREFLFHTIYRGPLCEAERTRAMFIVEHLYYYFMKHPEKMSGVYLKIVEEEGLEQGVLDFISCMSDDYCISLFNDIYVPRSLVPDISHIDFYPVD
ncbi:MAG: deoxyguanosinetriphosphate triphosphohydrolase [Syntrophomonadaceae bacterium]|nr:deoxyguanosinetriphosphate triphosphohydrolase [Syntrophomonadaceae bacterium]